MRSERIATHTVDALARLLEQYKGKPLVEGAVSAFVDQLQALEDAFDGIDSGRSVYDAVGYQIDRLGVVAGIDRPPGMEDASYRLVVLAKVGQNVSGGETEAVIAVLSVLTDASHVILEEHFPASLALFTDGTIPDGLGALVTSLMSSALAAGVSLEYVVAGDPNPFAFDGGGPEDGDGFGDANDPTVGGLLASVLT